jgi:hypothetical protein
MFAVVVVAVVVVVVVVTIGLQRLYMARPHHAPRVVTTSTRCTLPAITCSISASKLTTTLRVS